MQQGFHLEWIISKARRGGAKRAAPPLGSGAVNQLWIRIDRRRSGRWLNRRGRRIARVAGRAGRRGRGRRRIGRRGCAGRRRRVARITGRVGRGARGSTGGYGSRVTRGCRRRLRGGTGWPPGSGGHTRLGHSRRSRNFLCFRERRRAGQLRGFGQFLRLSRRQRLSGIHRGRVGVITRQVAAAVLLIARIVGGRFQRAIGQRRGRVVITEDRLNSRINQPVVDKNGIQVEGVARVTGETAGVQRNGQFLPEDGDHRVRVEQDQPGERQHQSQQSARQPHLQQGFFIFRTSRRPRFHASTIPGFILVSA